LLAVPVSAADKPNVVFVMADDLGYGDLGSYGQTKIKTPTLDKLAKEGIRLTRHYAGNAVCAPSRCVLMTGMHPGHAQVRNNREVKPEGQHPLTKDTATLARLLQANGYATGGFGKWGLGGPGSDGDPLKQGFDRFFGYNCQRVAHNFYPTYLWDDTTRRPLKNKPFPAHDKLKPGEDPTQEATYARFRGTEFAPDLITEEAIKFVTDNKAKPFFLYWPTTVPHLALQVPADSLKEYAGKWDDPPYPGGKGYTPTFNPRATYAAMVTRMDRDIGRLVDHLTKLGLEKNTIIVFTSDNGPLYDQLGGTDCEFFNSHGGLRGRKGSLYEGGFRVPGIVWWPGRIKPGASARVTGFEDWLPTVVELTGGANTPKGIDGISFAPTLLGEEQETRPFLYREFPGYGGQQAIIVARWKAVRQKLNPLAKDATPKTELYDLDADPTETTDVAAKNPEVLAKLEKLMADQHTPNPEFPIKVLDR
jgi:arylsulfatase A-like enzyme